MPPPTQLPHRPCSYVHEVRVPQVNFLLFMYKHRLEGLTALPLHSLRNHFLETVVSGNEFIAPETCTYFYRLYIYM